MKRTLSGFRAWLVQRFTAVYMLIFLVCALALFAFDGPQSYEEWRNLIATPLVMLTTALFFVALLLHAWVGLRDVMMDYVRPLPLRVGCLALLAFALTGIGLWVIGILLMARP